MGGSKPSLEASREKDVCSSRDVSNQTVNKRWSGVSSLESWKWWMTQYNPRNDQGNEQRGKGAEPQITGIFRTLLEPSYSQDEAYGRKKESYDRPPEFARILRFCALFVFRGWFLPGFVGSDHRFVFVRLLGIFHNITFLVQPYTLQKSFRRPSFPKSCLL